WQTVILVVGVAALSAATGYVLSLIPGQNTPYIDGTTNVLAIVAAILMMLRYREQFTLYIVLDGLSLVMWILRLAGGGPSAAVLTVMWAAYFINAFYGYAIWTRGSKKQNDLQESRNESKILPLIHK
ncbi:MAG: nicotinamide mononucleotide transporter, partial [Eggerthellaceae bacterium]|nr:nicotinamide mononucleotide transporter [Eggerthellaceae bacterium]